MAGGSFILILACLCVSPVSNHKSIDHFHAVSCAPQQPCVFRTLLGFEPFDTSSIVHSRELVDASLTKGLEWIANAQLPNGGWGAGTHSRQDVYDPHAVPADPATTALVGMALLRNGNTTTKGKYAVNLKKALDFLLDDVENTPEQSSYITNLKGTQPQVKLGQNIDAILTIQFFTNVIAKIQKKDCSCIERIEKAMNKCVGKIQQAQDEDGGIKNGGWAPVLQSALANNALESAKQAGAKVDDRVLEKSRNYQKGNFDLKTNTAETGKAAGVLLYSFSGSARASAKEARQADSAITKAKKEGKLSAAAPVTAANLEAAGYSTTEAKKYETAYKISGAASLRAQDGDVINGFGSNGGEEFLSYLMTGESLIISQDNTWKTWFEKMSGRMIQIQNGDGSWQGHHCITSPVFCTATCLLILSIDKDIDFLVKLN